MVVKTATTTSSVWCHSSFAHHFSCIVLVNGVDANAVKKTNYHFVFDFAGSLEESRAPQESADQTLRTTALVQSYVQTL